MHLAPTNLFPAHENLCVAPLILTSCSPHTRGNAFKSLFWKDAFVILVSYIPFWSCAISFSMQGKFLGFLWQRKSIHQNWFLLILTKGTFDNCWWINIFDLHNFLTHQSLCVDIVQQYVLNMKYSLEIVYKTTALDLKNFKRPANFFISGQN